MVELADIFRDAGPAYLQRFGDRMLPSHKRVLSNIVACRTPALGGQMYFCPRCDLEVAGDRRFVGGLTGVMAMLHTCTRTMIFHPHVHIVFPVGGLGEDGNSWIKPRTRNYILPSYAVSRIFREEVEREYRREGLFDLVPKKTWCRPWRTKMMLVGTGEKVLLYLSRYLFRVAISAERILAHDGARVTFKAKAAPVALDAEEFTWSKVFGHFEGLSASLFSVLPDRFALRNLIALD